MIARNEPFRSRTLVHFIGTLQASYVPGTVHSTGDSLASKTRDGLSLTESIFNGGNGNLQKEKLTWCGDREAFPKEGIL